MKSIRRIRVKIFKIYKKGWKSSVERDTRRDKKF